RRRIQQVQLTLWNTRRDVSRPPPRAGPNLAHSGVLAQQWEHELLQRRQRQSPSQALLLEVVDVHPRLIRRLEVARKALGPFAEHLVPQLVAERTQHPASPKLKRMPHPEPVPHQGAAL